MNSECFLSRFQRMADRQPNHLAVDCNSPLTYHELDLRSNQLAQFLLNQTQQRQRETPLIVAVSSDRRPEMLVAILGILKANGAYLPVDPSYPAIRKQFIFDDAKPQLLLTATENPKSELADCPSFCLLNDWNEIDRESSNAVERRQQSLAYVIYTSGSTGKPKGVMLGMDGLSDMANAHADAFSLTSESRVLQFASYNFDASVSEIFMTLFAGGTLCLVEQERLLPGNDLVETLEKKRITNVLLPPSALAVLPKRELPELKTLISGGERCDANLVNQWGRGRDVFNAYGPTECTVTATIHHCNPPCNSEPPIGTAREFASVYILDEKQHPVEGPEIGELYIGGSGVALGYINRPDLDHLSFFEDPFSTTGGRMYRTGDLVRRNENGEIEFHGRVDRQVKIRGHRVELGEIENCLKMHPQVRQVAAKVFHADTNQPKIVTYLTCNQCASANGNNNFRDWLAERLPQFMIPNRFIVLDDLPLNENLKIDYSALPDLQTNASIVESEITLGDSTASQSNQASLRKTIHETWCRVFKLTADQVAANDHFVELGGDSLLSAKIAVELRDRGITIKPQDVFDHPTIQELTEFVNVR